MRQPKYQTSLYYHTQWTAQGSVFGTVCDFVCLCMKYLRNCWMDLCQIYTEDMFRPSLRRVWRSRSRPRGTKTTVFGPFGSLCAVCLAKHLKPALVFVCSFCVVAFLCSRWMFARCLTHTDRQTHTQTEGVTNIHFTSVTPHAKHKYKREMGFTGGHIRKNLLQRYPNKDMRQLSTLHTLPTIMHELSTLHVVHYVILHWPMLDIWLPCVETKAMQLLHMGNCRNGSVASLSQLCMKFIDASNELNMKITQRL